MSSLFVRLCVCLCVFTVCLYVRLGPCLSQSLSLSVCLCPRLSQSLSPSVSVSVLVCLCFCVSLSPSVCLCPCLFLPVSVCPAEFIGHTCVCPVGRCLIKSSDLLAVNLYIIYSFLSKYIHNTLNYTFFVRCLYCSFITGSGFLLHS